ncbi:MAG: PQQ-binding-like beta-propeller repeat protein [Candidatus Poribacteria bacterium]|nr:PQQ-binding-like beta-propeller repeat protein [Candidatus Poribacteria bacterium]MDE0468820.1 PQQ-binding-like beta-propeller repeat protein [Candidatus Poribacteria bacterium]
MKRIAILTICIFALAAVVVLASQPVGFEKNWHHWRGPHATGAAVDANPPTTWSETENIRWKIAIPGTGHAAPIIWEDKIFIQTAIEVKANESEGDDNPFGGFFGGNKEPLYKFDLLAINRSDGSILWQKTLREIQPHEGTHGDATYASNSPVTDGEYIYAYFGSRGLYCVDMMGNVKWEKDIGTMYKRNTFGEGSSPALYGDILVILQDHEGDSFITALNKRTGDVLWKTNRNERTTWSSPLVVEHDGKAQVITTGTNRVRSYDLETGKLLWDGDGLTANSIPSPVAAEGFVYLMSGFRGSEFKAVYLAKANGDITDSGAIAWEYNRDTPYVPSPLLYKDAIYFLKENRGILSAFNIKTGEAHYGPKRLQGVSGVYASIVGAGDRVYIAGRNGVVNVLQHGPEFSIIAENTLDDSFNASPAIVGSELYLRGGQYLYCIAE